ncbi:hypothetical protein ATN84_01055 [Paramesorhizobium deserti]|uniref:Uncharacterized protein n=1 Tax=Paramesorhizobium deserti TaxID=1494590 RepID=A0A135HYX9_9HYPH|nr:hypothetical protein ATN84_01055 [Paramesorhizobium deserti]
MVLLKRWQNAAHLAVILGLVPRIYHKKKRMITVLIDQAAVDSRDKPENDGQTDTASSWF